MNDGDMRRWLPRVWIGRAGKGWRRWMKPKRWADGSVKARLILFGRTVSFLWHPPVGGGR